VASVRTTICRPEIGRSVSSCSVVRSGPPPRVTHARKRRAVTTDGAWPNVEVLCAESAAVPAAAAAALFFRSWRLEIAIRTKDSAARSAQRYLMNGLQPFFE
jgi:hypothetical protein